MNKRAVELSMNFFVILVITLVIFGFGITFVYKIRDESNRIIDMKFDDLNRKVEDLLCQTSDKTCMGISQLTIKKGDFDFFNLKVINVNDADRFTLKVDPANPPGIDKNKNDISLNPNYIPLYYVPKDEEFEILNNEEKKIGIAIGVPKKAIPGIYIFNVVINYMKGDPEEKPYDNHQILVKVT